MKPNFALDFRNDAITLLHRTARGWQVVGQVGLDSADLATDLSYLRATALELSPKGMTTKLVIPNAQILYTQVPVTAQDTNRRRKQVARALDGVTPYAVADLAFDFSGTGPTVDVAVIAKETLAEAEAFAIEHRFNPVSFVAVPDRATFTTEPWFGPTGSAATYLTEGQRVERDPAPLSVLGRESSVTTPEAPPAQTAEPELGFADPVESAPAAPEDVAQAMPAEPEPLPVEPEPPVTDLPEPETTPEPAPIREPGSEPSREPDLEPEEVLARLFEAENAQRPVPDLPPEPEAPPAPEPPAADWTAPATPVAEAAPPEPGVEEAPMALDVIDEQAEDLVAAAAPQAPASVLDPSIPDDLPPPMPSSVMVAFGSRRALEASAKEAAARAGAGKPAVARSTVGKPASLAGITATRTGPQAKVTMLPPRPSQPSVVRMPQRPATGTAPGAALPGLTGDAAKMAKPAAKTSAAAKALRGLGALVTSPGIAGAKERRATAQIVTPPTGPTSAASAAAATLNKAGAKPYSGGLGNRSLEKPKPRYLGLILTGILLVFLVLVAAWSTLFLETSDATAPAPETVVGAVAAPDPEAVADAGGDTAAASDSAIVDPEMLADLQVPEPVAEPVAELAPDPATTVPVTTDAEADAVAAAVAEAVAETPPEPSPITVLDAEAAATALRVAEPQDEFLLATMDEPPAMPDALSLPKPVARNDAPPVPAVPPPPFGTVYQFDAQGLIVPTPEGIMTPEGVMVIAGRPTREPPPRPAALAPVAVPTPATTPAPGSPSTLPAAPANTAAAPFADPALAGARPRQRPDGLAPATQNADDDASLAPADGSRFASLRPQAKPASLVAAAAEAPADPIADLGAQAASLTAQANATAAASASGLTLAVSRKPAPRPRDMSRAVEEAVAVASRQPAPQPQVEEPTTKTAPEADDEPEVASAMPRLPTKTTVAKQATYVNAINLSKVNLIGVYGSANERYALIRQTNGRYKKVKVGDSFDGGRVAAITASEVRYQKSGKMITLALPKS